RPRRPTVLTAWPPSETKPRNEPLICDVPEVIVALCSVSAVLVVPARMLSLRVTMSTFCGVLKLSRRMREPVMTIAPFSAVDCPCALVGALVGGTCSLSCVFCGVVSTGAGVCAKAGEAVKAVSEIVDKMRALTERIVSPSPKIGLIKSNDLVEDGRAKKKRIRLRRHQIPAACNINAT